MTSIFNDKAKNELGVSGMAGRYVDKVSAYCTERYNAETGRPKNMKRFAIIKRKSIEIVKNACFELHKENKHICVESVLKHINALHISDGTLQRQILNVMVCYGRLKKKIIKTSNDRELVIYKWQNNLDICPKLKNGKCTFKWEYAHRGRIKDIIKTPPVNE